MGKGIVKWGISLAALAAWPVAAYADRFQGEWEYKSAAGEARGTASILSEFGRICGLWRTGTGKNARVRVFFGKTQRNGELAHVRVSDYLDPAGRKAPTWSPEHYALSNYGTRIEASLWGPGMRLTYRTLNVAPDKLLKTACADRQGFEPGAAQLWKEHCTLDGKPVTYPADRDALQGRSGTLRCTFGDQPSLEAQIKDGKWVGTRTKFFFASAARHEDEVDERGVPNGWHRYYENDKLVAERRMAQGSATGEEKLYHPDGKPRRIARGGESVDYDSFGRISDVTCTQDVNLLPEARVLCGFDGPPVARRVYGSSGEQLLTYSRGRLLKHVLYWESHPQRIRIATAIEGNLDKRQTFYLNGQPELESETFVDAAGNKAEPRKEWIKNYYESGQLQSHLRWEGKMLTEDWWHPNGRKHRESRPSRIRLNGLPAIRNVTTTWDAEGRRLGQETKEMYE